MSDKINKTPIFLTTNDFKIPEPVEYTQTNRNFVIFGDNNEYPNELYKCYSECSILQALINGCCDYIVGEETEDMKGIEVNPKQSLYELIKQVSLDYMIFGSFAIQVLKNEFGDIKQLYSLDPRKIRMSEDEEMIFYSPQYFKGYNVSKKIVSYPSFGDHRNSIFYFKRPSLRSIYGLPLWNGSLKSILSLIEIDRFHITSILNDFCPSAIVSFNNGVPEEITQKQIEEKINSKFSGSSNASKLLITFSDSKETSPEISTLESSDFDTRFQELYKTCRENVFISFRATSQLFGLSPDITAFNSEEFNQSFKLFKTTVISPIQREIEKAFTKLGYNINLPEFIINFDERSDYDITD